ncbi:uncharacterized protein [Palaemon carinicauda]|uniref:uncharacterized protein n=1 Tax=Palaemon carinicauda TaxID=392227 RepID=UPI0035B60A5A
MIIQKIVLVLSVIYASGNQAVIDPYLAGPHEVKDYFLMSKDTGLTEVELNAWSPLSPGIYPILYFLDGLAMNIPGIAYTDFLSHIASHGFLVVTPFVTATTSKPSEKVPYFRAILEWAEVNLQDLLHENGVPADVLFDFETLFANSHSAGGHAIVSYLQETCGNFKGLILMSPVDGADPFGFVDDFCITPGEQLNFITPTLHLYTGYDAKKGLLGTACAPKKLSNERFWEALNPESHRWSINATEFGHADVLDAEFRVFVDQTEFCGVNRDLQAEDYPIYRNFSSGTVVAFLQTLLVEDYAGYLNYLEDVSVMPIVATERHFTPAGERPSPYCLWTPPLQ